MMVIWHTIFLTFVVSPNVQSQSRLVVNTTCLELAKPSNQHLRLTCRQHDYHCLLDETFTKEFEACKEWKWIPRGKCAYFNTYEYGNIDGRPCISSANLFCPNVQYSSADTPKYSTCYMKKNTYMIGSTTSSYRRRSTSFPFSETTDKKTYGTWIDIHIFVYIAIAVGVAIVISLSIVVLCSRYRKVNDGKTVTQMSDEKCDDQNAEQHSLIYARNDKPEDRQNKDENGVQGKSPGMSLDQQKVENEDAYKHKCENDSDAKPQQTVKIDDKKQDDKKPAGIMEILQRIAPPTDERDKKLFRDIYNLLCLEGPKITQKIMEAIITRKTMKSVQELVADEKVMSTVEKNLPKEFCHPNANEKCQNLFVVSYCLLRIYLDEEDHPKSGWGNPVNEKDIGIGDDIERLYNIHSTVCEIIDPDTVSVESYIRLLDIMIEALTRLDPGADLRALNKEIACIKRITQT